MAHTFINKFFVNNKYIDISLICLPLLCEVFLLQLSDNPVIGIVFLISCIITTTTVVFRLKECKTTIIPRIFIAYFCFLVIGLSLVFSQELPLSPLWVWTAETWRSQWMQCRACTSIAERQGKGEAKMLPLLLNRIDCHITLCKPKAR